MDQVNLEQLHEALLVSWSAETGKGEWTPDCPSLNQCAVTALVVQDYFGGELLRCPFGENDSHYWNRLPDGQEVDLTWAQFDYLGRYPNKPQSAMRTREYVLSFPDTMRRYELLKQIVGGYWTK